MKVFGVGCIWFAPASEVDQKNVKRDEFLKSLHDNFERIENISNVKSESLFEKPYMNATIVEHSGKRVVIPVLHGCSISFDIFLPYRVQEKIHEPLSVENLHVQIHFGYDMPVAFIWYDHDKEAKKRIRPSTAVVVVRKYLEQKLLGTGIICGCIGPSPFHADFKVLIDSSVVDYELRDLSKDHTGYADVELVLSTDTVKSFLYALGQAKFLFAKFYHLCNLRNRAIDHHMHIVNCSNELVQEQPRAFWKRVVASFRQRRPIDNMNRHLVSERLLRMQMEQEIEESDRVGLTGDTSPLYHFFEEYRRMSIRTSWSQFGDIAKFFEDRRHHVFRNLTAIVAGVVGGLLGAVIGSLLTYLLAVGR